jgi:heparan-alpha-glucosaminide N-acetyltransferase
LLHTEAYEDGMGLSDWVFPGFLFMVGVSIPFAIANRQKLGDSVQNIVKHILFRAGSLILISLLIFNRGKLYEDYVGVSKFVWALLLYLAIFLVWNNYSKIGNKIVLFRILQGVGVALIIFLLVAFRSGNAEEIGWLQRGWWGILGLIGWGYLVGALGSLWSKDSVLKCGILCIVFLVLNMLSSAGLLGFLDFLNPVFNVVLEGNIPFIVLTGVLIGLFIKKYNTQPTVLFLSVLLLALASLVMGFFLRNWFIISKIYATPSWGLICNGISLTLFALFYYFVDVQRWRNGLGLFLQVGQNSLTTYIIPDVVYLIIWTFGLPVFFYKYLGNPLWCIVGSLVWAFAMLWLAIGLKKIYVQLKL